MNRTLWSLKRQAAQTAFLRGHQMYWTAGAQEKRTELTGCCKRCGQVVVCTSTPQVNQPHVTGSALQANCSGPRMPA
jgi:hypothetical protein